MGRRDPAAGRGITGQVPPSISVHQAGVVVWDRARIRPVLATKPRPELRGNGKAGVLCLESTGFIANRSELVARISASEPLSDPQLLLQLYGRYGADAARHIAGTFGWILWDERRQRLVAARDRAGLHGLYFTVRGDRLLLARRVETLLAASPDPVSWNPRAVVAHIHADPPPPGETFYQGIQALEPGSLFTATDRGQVTERYWQIGPRPVLRLRSDAAYAACYRDVLFRIVAEYAPAQPVAVTLSGGLDSTSVAVALCEAVPATEVTAVRWLAPELPEADESRFSEAVRRKLGCRDATLRADRHWSLKLDRGIRPWRASPSFNFYTDLWDAAFRRTRQCGIRHLLTGHSGDSLVGGNVFAYPDLLLTGRWRKLAAEMAAHDRVLDISLARLARGTLLGPLARYYLPGFRSKPRRTVEWLGERFKGSYHCRYPETPWRLLPGRRQRLEQLLDPLLPTIGEELNRQAAEHGVELRHPCLDHRLFELAASLPAWQTFSAGVRKIIVRNAMRGYLPNEVIEYPRKIYPTAIAERGLKEREQAKLWPLMTKMRAAELGFVDEKRLREAYRKYLAGKEGDDLFLCAITLEVWLRRYFD